jgi:hypothetical protein
MTRMDTGRTNQTIDQDRRRLLGAATMGMAVAGAASLLPSQLAAAPRAMTFAPSTSTFRKRTLRNCAGALSSAKWKPGLGCFRERDE